MATSALTVLRVFVGPGGNAGNPLGVFLDGGAVPEDRRQSVAEQLGFSETVFIDHPGRGELRIHTPTVELPFAGHPLVGAAWLLEHTGHAVQTLRPPAGEVATWREDDVTWIRARPEWPTPFELNELPSPAAVERHPVPADEDAMLNIWAWEDEAQGRVRARVFPRAIGVSEDEATGGAAVGFAAHLGRPVTIHQGTGSVIAARPGPDGTVEVGGRCLLVETADHELA